MKISKKISPNNQYFIPFICFILLVLSHTNLIAQEKFKVVLDAGHGGKDPGKHTHKYNEKDIALNIVLLVGKKLESNKDISVIYTRKTDVFIDLKERGKIANQANANLFVSVHCNAHSSQAYGAETYVLGLHANRQNFEVAKQENSVIFLEDNYQEKYAGFDPNSPEAVIGMTLMQEEYLDQSLMLASNIQNSFTDKLKRKNRGVKQAGFVVLHQTYMPSVLIETGFITNTQEGAYLGSKSGQEKIANSIYEAIMAYKKHIDANIVIEEVKPVAPKVDSKSRVFEGVNFKVQIASSSKKVATKAYNFRGLKNIERVKVGKHYKYYFGNTSNYDEIVKLQKEAKKSGYTSAFVVAFKGEEKVSVNELLSSK